VRAAQGRYGKGKRITGEQMRWGLENLNLDQKALDGMGLAGVMRPVQTSCLDHMGSAWARVHTWDGKKWNFSSDWYQGDEKVLRPMVMQGLRGQVCGREEDQAAHCRKTARSNQPDHTGGGRFARRSDPPSVFCSLKEHMTTANILLNVNSIEVIYNHVILVLKGVSLSVPEGSIVALLGGNGAGKTTTLRAVSNLLHGERGEVTKGSIECRGERIEALTPADLVKRGVVQVMEGRHCFGHLTIEENLMTGSYTRSDGKAAVAQTLEKVYNYFPRLKTRRTSQAAYTSGGEQQMCAIGRALMANPTMVLLDEPSMGLAPQIVDEVFGIVKDLNQREKVTFLLAEQNTNMALRYADFGYILETAAS
jgi:branched-chain amino acid transport system ATP-binding protein